MHRDAVWKLIVFNLLLMITEVILFSRGLVNLSAYPLPALFTGVVSIAAFIGINYWILTAAGTDPGYHSGKLKDIEDYQNALEFWMRKSNPFRTEIRSASSQLDVFRKKQYALKALLGDRAREEGSPFLSVSEDVQSCLLINMKKILNRMTIIDPAEKSRYPMHAEYIRRILSQNQQLLSEYDNLVIEISQIGDSSQMQSLQLEAITQALRELRDEDTGTAAQSEMF